MWVDSKQYIVPCIVTFCGGFRWKRCLPLDVAKRGLSCSPVRCVDPVQPRTICHRALCGPRRLLASPVTATGDSGHQRLLGFMTILSVWRWSMNASPTVENYAHFLHFRCPRCPGYLASVCCSLERNLEPCDAYRFSLRCGCGWTGELFGSMAMRHWVDAGEGVDSTTVLNCGSFDDSPQVIH